METKSLLGSTRRADITFHRSGRIDITSVIAKALDLHSGDAIDIIASGGEFYIYVVVRASEMCGRHEASCYPTKPRSSNFRTWCHRLCTAMLKECGETETVRLPSGAVTTINNHHAVSLITRNKIKHG